MGWITYVLALIPAIAAAIGAVIPLINKLVEYVRKATREKNWKALLELVMKLMCEAEGKFENHTDRKEWVLAIVKASADTVNYDIDTEEIGRLIDDLCAMSKLVNPPLVKHDATDDTMEGVELQKEAQL